MVKSIMNKKSLIIILLTALAMLTAAGCASRADVNTEGMYLVIYDGNGGYLGNKTATVRKLYCQPDSKIPNYPVDYTEKSYIVSSLGLAMRAGFQLNGWYTDADYSENESGDYVYLSTEDGNGVYTLDGEGTFVHKYIPSEDGDFVFVYADNFDAETAETDENTYVFINAEREEDQDPLSVQTGFYVCNGDEDISEIADDDLREAYQAAFAEKKYPATEVAKVNGYQLYEELSADYRELFAGLTKYVYTYVAAEEGDEDLDHYSLASDYIFLDNIFREDPKGAFVQEGRDYVPFDEEKEEHSALVRFSVDPAYIFTEESTEGMKRFDAAMHYWDFRNRRVTEADCTFDGEKNVLTLKAHWTKKNTVFYHYNNGTGQVDEATQRLLPDNTTYVNYRQGEIIGKKEIVPKKAGYTFIGWSKSEEKLDLWNYSEDVFPEGTNELHLYASYIEGDYTRIASVKALQKIGENPDGKFFIADDIDFSGATLEKSPMGFKDGAVFTGEIISYGATLKNFTVSLKGKKSQLMGSGEAVGASLIPETDGAYVRGLNLEFSVSCTGVSSKGVESDMTVQALFEFSGLFGTASGQPTTVEDCSVKYKAASSSASTLNSNVVEYDFTLADFVLRNANLLKLSGCTSEIGYEELTGNVKVEEIRIAE